MTTKTNSIGIQKWAGNQDIAQIATADDGDSKVILWQRMDGAEAVETNGDPVLHTEENFDANCVKMGLK